MDYYQYYKMIGRCVRCRKVPATPGYTMCEACREKVRLSYHNPEAMQRRREVSTEWNRRRREAARESGTCYLCGAPALPGYIRCPACAKKNAASTLKSQRKKRAMCMAQDLCPDCGRPWKAGGDYVTCDACRAKGRSYYHQIRREAGKR